MDKHTKEQRSYNMSRIRSQNTKPEITLIKIMKVLKLTYQPKKVIGNPDFANKKQKIAVFIDGCFWHKCPKHYVKPKTNIKFWKDKIKKNIQRDEKVTKNLKEKRWRVIRIWEHDIKKVQKDLRKV